MSALGAGLGSQNRKIRKNLIFNDCRAEALQGRNRRFRDKMPFRVWHESLRAKKDASRRTAECWLHPQHHAGLAALFVPALPRNRQCLPVFRGLRRERTRRRSPLSKRLLGRAALWRRRRERRRRDGRVFLPVHRTDNRHCRSSSSVRCTVRREARRFGVEGEPESSLKRPTTSCKGNSPETCKHLETRAPVSPRNPTSPAGARRRVVNPLPGARLMSSRYSALPANGRRPAINHRAHWRHRLHDRG